MADLNATRRRLNNSCDLRGYVCVRARIRVCLLHPYRFIETYRRSTSKKSTHSFAKLCELKSILEGIHYSGRRISYKVIFYINHIKHRTNRLAIRHWAFPYNKNPTTQLSKTVQLVISSESHQGKPCCGLVALLVNGIFLSTLSLYDRSLNSSFQ